MGYQLLSELTLGYKYSTICVRVSRIWDFRGAADEGPIKHVDLVLIDEKGNKMYAEVGGNLADHKRPLLQEGRVYIISKFGVERAKTEFRAVEASLMIKFVPKTTIEEKINVPAHFPLYTYNLVPFEELESYIGKTTRFIDVIGAITSVSEAKPAQAPGRTTPSVKRIILLKDLRGKQLKVSLWGQRADEFSGDAVIEIGQNQPVIAIFVGCLMKKYIAGETLSGNAACRWYINEDILDIRDFYQSLNGKFEKIEKIPVDTREYPTSIAAEKLQAKELKELKDMDAFEHSNDIFLCIVTITRLSPNQRWWFAQCKDCGKGTIRRGSTHKCSTQGCKTSDIKLKYKLCLMGSDGTAELEFILFGGIAENIIGKPFYQLEANIDADDTPLEITNIIHQKFSFAVAFTKRSFTENNPSLEVKQIIFKFGNPPNIVAAQADSIESSSTSNKKALLLPLTPIKPLSPTMQFLPEDKHIIHGSSQKRSCNLPDTDEISKSGELPATSPDSVNNSESSTAVEKSAKRPKY